VLVHVNVPDSWSDRSRANMAEVINRGRSRARLRAKQLIGI